MSATTTTTLSTDCSPSPSNMSSSRTTFEPSDEHPCAAVHPTVTMSSPTSTPATDVAAARAARKAARRAKKLARQQAKQQKKQKQPQEQPQAPTPKPIPDLRTIMQDQPIINVGTLGHVAHGKSTLVRALTSKSTAKFHKEQERNMTIKLGYANVKIWKCDNPLCPAPWSFQATGSEVKTGPVCKRPNCTHTSTLVSHISLVDSPGHHELMSTMMSGAAVMDSALLVIAANEPCPCPQTEEHLATAEMMNITEQMIVLQNKIDLMSSRRAAASNKVHIDELLGATRARDSPVVPISAQHELNMDVVCEYLARIPVPARDLESPARMYVIRSFDVNKPGQPAKKLRGGVIGGSVLRGVLRVGDEIEVRPGLVRTDGTVSPLITRVASLLSEKQKLQQAVPGGLIGVGLDIDPALCKSDRLVGSVAGAPGSLPPVFNQCTIKYTLMQRVASSEDGKDTEEEDADASSNSNQPRLRVGDRLLCCFGSSRVEAELVELPHKSKRKKHKKKKKKGARMAVLRLRKFACAELDSTVAIFKVMGSDNKNRRLVGMGSVAAIEPLPELAEPTSTTSEAQTPGHEPEPLPLGDLQALAPSLEFEDSDDEQEPGDDVPLTRLDSFDEALHGECRMYERELPEAGEHVMVTVEHIEERVGAYVRLLNYNNVQGLIVETEVTRRRIRRIGQVISEGDTFVAEVQTVDAARGHIDLSRKRVDEEDREAFYTKHGGLTVLHSALKSFAREERLPLEVLYRAFGWRLGRIAARLAVPPTTLLMGGGLTDGELETWLAQRLRVPAELVPRFAGLLMRRFRTRVVKLRVDLEIVSLGVRGVHATKAALTEALRGFPTAHDFKAYMHSAPHWVVEAQGRDRFVIAKLLETAVRRMQLALVQHDVTVRVSEPMRVLNE